MAATAQLAAQEYRIGVIDGRVEAKAEVEEAALFLQESRRSAALLPAAASAAAVEEIDTLIRLVAAIAPADSLDAHVRALTDGLTRRLGITLDEIPAQTPSLARGAEVYRGNCAGCHGASGQGDGPLAAGMHPAPANLASAADLRDVSPLDYYRRISIGTVGTAMPAFEGRLAPEDRWAAALYASILRMPAPRGEVPPSLRTFATTGTMSDDQVLAALGVTERARSEAMGRLAAVRVFQADHTGAATAQVFDQVRGQLDSAFALARAGDAAASARAFDAYMTFEQVERGVRAKNPALAAQLETAFASLRTRAAGGATSTELDALRRQLDAGLESAERVLTDESSPFNLFVQSFIIMLREGLEAILIVGALMTFLSKMGAGHRKRDIHIGVGAAVGASIATAVALETIFVLSPARREALEGATMVVATAVLFYVSYWLLSKMEVVKWNHFVRSKVQDALNSGSALALATAAFLAVYREGFETVLFYKALFVAGAVGGAMPVVGGILAGSVVLVFVYIAINRFGVRLPLKPFFAVTSAFLYYMAFVFAGKGIAELQEGGLIGTTILPWAPRIPALGIYPTAESLGAQGLLLALAVLALVWNFVVEPRRMRGLTTVMVPEPRPPAAPPVSPVSHESIAPGAVVELLRSLERMEADLAEMRAEVERMRRHLTADAPAKRERTSR
ncbi:MAG TPA: cytochrome c/FTR1 family iron permease [Gemmatimonadales bacterium]|nr:cytochrome c/FTR1 family iron permease [Gemmatimonadales bacterium]